jgi:Restriction endonuclease fold toxin 9
VWSSPYINHFLQPDSLIPDPVNPQAWNRYSYVGNRPVNFSDPSGHQAWDGDNGNYTKADAEYNRQRIDALKCRAGNKAYCSSGEKHPVETVVTVLAGLVTAGALPEIGVVGDAVYTAAGTACLRTPICITITGMAGGAGYASAGRGESSDTILGRQAHARYAEMLGEPDYVYNKQIPGTRLRPDAIDVANNIVRELKPDNPQAIARGLVQLAKYVDALENYTGEAWTGILDLYTK